MPIKLLLNIPKDKNMDKIEYKRIKKRFKETIKEDGLFEAIRKSIIYLKCNFNVYKKKTKFKNVFYDVLFVNGCSLEHPHRYRVSHQMEQLESFNVKCNEVFYLKLKYVDPKYYRFVILYRCPITKDIITFIKKARKINKKIFFDIDDLVIDTKFTNDIPYLKQMSFYEKKAYDDGVRRMCETLKLCDGAITTTEDLAFVLKKYVNKVYVNRNVASDDILFCSEKALFYSKELIKMNYKEIPFNLRKRYKLETDYNLKKMNYVDIGYFSGSVTHNDDINMALPFIEAILKKYSNVRFCFMGILDIPEKLKKFSNRIFSFPFCDWKRLPYFISKVDINFVPLVDSIFNRCKSENKWIEASFVKIPTVASNVGAFKRMIINGKTGFLCDNNIKSWVNTLSNLIENKILRNKIGENAYNFVNNYCYTLKTGFNLYKIIKNNMTKNFAFVLPSSLISGGILVALKHAQILQNNGYDVLMIVDGKCEETDFTIQGSNIIPKISLNKTFVKGRIDQICATLWTTNRFCSKYSNKGEHLYLVQGYETNFYKSPNLLRRIANSTYALNNVKYITISKWCSNWLKNYFSKESSYIPNCIDLNLFSYKRRTFKNKIRILIEGNCNDFFKNIDEAFKITNQLDKSKYEIWYISYQGYPKKWYCYDKFFHNISHNKMPEIYKQCHILLKTSILESFSFPPLEMIATGGFCVVRKNEGNVEYLINKTNCLFYDCNNIKSAIDCIEKISTNKELRKKLETNGLITAKNRDWSKNINLILKAYVS